MVGRRKVERHPEPFGELLTDLLGQLSLAPGRHLSVEEAKVGVEVRECRGELRHAGNHIASRADLRSLDRHHREWIGGDVVDHRRVRGHRASCRIDGHLDAAVLQIGDLIIGGEVLLLMLTRLKRVLNRFQ